MDLPFQGNRDKMYFLGFGISDLSRLGRDSWFLNHGIQDQLIYIENWMDDTGIRSEFVIIKTWNSGFTSPSLRLPTVVSRPKNYCSQYSDVLYVGHALKT